jgi:hypothetical protein
MYNGSIMFKYVILLARELAKVYLHASQYQLCEGGFVIFKYRIVVRD